MTPNNPLQDLAADEDLGTMTPFQLWIGEAQIVSDSAPALDDIDKYQVCALTDTGITPFVVADHTANQAVVAAQPAVTGAQTPYWNAGKFNHEALVWPVELDTLPKRKAFLIGTMLGVGHLN